MKSFRELLHANRSYRRFDQSAEAPIELLRDLVGLTRYAPSACNFQPVKYIISNDRETNEKIFSTLGWAKQLAGWDGPVEGEHPSAFIIILFDGDIPKAMELDGAIAAHTILLGAAEAGYQGCMLGNIRKNELRDLLAIPASYEIHLVCAIGKAAEDVILEDYEEDSGRDTLYYRDGTDAHRVPKRTLGELLIAEYTEPQGE